MTCSVVTAMKGSPLREISVPMSLRSFRWIWVPWISWRGSAEHTEAAAEKRAKTNNVRTACFMDPPACGMLQASSVTWSRTEAALVVHRWRADPGELRARREDGEETPSAG